MSTPNPLVSFTDASSMASVNGSPSLATPRWKDELPEVRSCEPKHECAHVVSCSCACGLHVHQLKLRMACETFDAGMHVGMYFYGIHLLALCAGSSPCEAVVRNER